MESHRVDLGGGVETAVRVWTSSAVTAPVLLFLPAMGMAAKYYEPFASALNIAGFHVVLGDFRNHGAGSVTPRRGVDFGYTALVRGDCAQMVAFAKARFPSSALFIGGHSLGGHVTALYATLAPPGELAGVVGIAAGSVHYRGWSGLGALRILALTQLAGVVSRVVGYFPGKRLGFAGLEPKTQMIDWARTARTGRFEPRGDAHDYEARMREVSLPVLALSIADDDYAPQSAARQLYGKLSRAKLEFVELRVEAFGLAKVGHFAWVKTPAPVVETLRAWVASAIAHAA